MLQLRYMFIFLLALMTACSNNSGSQAAEDDTAAMETPYEIKDNDRIIENGMGDADRDKIYRHADVDVKPIYGHACKTSADPWECTMNTVEIFIQDNINWPHDVIKQNEDGYEEISFVVTTEGDIQHVEHIVSKDKPCPGCQEAAMEVVKKMDDWEAGQKDGKPVAVQLTVPIQ